MTPAATCADFVRDPRDHYLVGRTWLLFCTARPCAGVVMWSRPSEDDVRELLRGLPVSDSLLAHRMMRFFDVRRLEGVDPAAFARLAEYAALHETELSTVIERAAVVHARGLSAAVSAGFAHVAPVSFPMDLFTEPRAALEWLGVDVAVEGELDLLYAQAIGVSPILRNLRALVRTKLSEATLHSVAEALAVSSRSLQRRLSEEGTSFKDELDAARVETAQKRLLESEATLGEVASAVGFVSVTRFSEMFRRRTGESPVAWRAKRRR